MQDKVNKNYEEEEVRAVNERLKEIIRLHGSQAEFKRATGLPGSTISAIMQDRIRVPKITILLQTVRKTGVNWEWLIEGEGAKFNPRKATLDLQRVHEQELIRKARNNDLSDSDLEKEEEIRLLQELLEKKMNI